MHHWLPHEAREILREVSLQLGAEHPLEGDLPDHRQGERPTGSHREGVGELRLCLHGEEDTIADLEVPFLKALPDEG